MISVIAKLLTDDKELYAWNVKKIEKKEYQLFFIKRELDMNREVNVTKYYVTIFMSEEVDGKKVIGKTNFEVYPTMSKKEIKDAINSHKTACKFSYNKMYKLPRKQELKPVDYDTFTFDGHSLKEAAFIIADTLIEADNYKFGLINSFEIFVGSEKTRFVDSSNNDFKYQKEYSNVEYIINRTNEKEETVDKDNVKVVKINPSLPREAEIELYGFMNLSKIDSKAIKEEISNKINEATDRMEATPLSGVSSTTPLLLGRDEIIEFFKFFINKCSIDCIYNKESDYRISDNIQKDSENTDKISIKLQGTMKNSIFGMPFDKDGVVLKLNSIIESGIVKNMWGSNEKSQLLKHPVHGVYENYIINTGSLSEEELEEKEYLEIVSVSGFDVDLVTGDFGSEIRLAYLHKNGKKIPLTSGSFSGNVNDSLKHLRIANTSMQRNNYFGPKYILIDNIQYLSYDKN